MLPLGNGLMTVNAAHLVSWLSVYMVHLCWLCAGLGRAFWPFHGCQSFCSLCAYPTTAGPLPVTMSDTMFVPKTVFRISDCLLWHVLNDTKIQNYYATPMVTKKNGLNYSKLNYYFRTGSVVNKVLPDYK